MGERGVGGIVFARGTPTTVNPCDRTIRIGNVMFLSNRVPISPTANRFIPKKIARRAARIFRGVGGMLTRTNLAATGVMGAAMFLTSVSLFTRVGTICTGCFRKSFPTHSTMTIGTLPGKTLIRVRDVTIEWQTFHRQLRKLVRVVSVRGRLLSVRPISVDMIYDR